MGTITVAGRSIEVDEAGYLVNRADWSEHAAKQLAWVDNCELTPAHWEVINFMREYHEEHQLTPIGRMLAKTFGKKFGPDKGNNRYLYELFPYGPHRQAVRYAGLPRIVGII